MAIKKNISEQALILGKRAFDLIYGPNGIAPGKASFEQNKNSYQQFGGDLLENPQKFLAQFKSNDPSRKVWEQALQEYQTGELTKTVAGAEGTVSAAALTPQNSGFKYNETLPTGFAEGANKSIVKVPTGYVLQNGYYVDPKTVSAPITKDLLDYSSLPNHIKNDQYFKQMDEQAKKLLAFNYNVAKMDTAIARIKADKAMDEAIKLAEPRFKQQLLLAQDSIKRELAVFLSGNKEAKAKLDSDLEEMKQDIVRDAGRLTSAEIDAKLQDMESIRIVADQAVREGESRESGVAAELARTQRRINALSEDLKYGKEQLSLEEQATLGRQLKEYQRNLQTTQEQAVDAGLGFSSIRAEAEKRLFEDLQDVSESTRRQKARQLRDIETQAGRDTTELLVSEQEIKRKNQEARVDIARQIEQKTGFDSIPPKLKEKILEVDPGFAPIGIRGNLIAQQEKREKDIAQRQEDFSTQQKRGEEEAARQAKILERKREQGVADVARKAEELLGSENLPKIAGAPAPLGGIAGTLEAERGKEAVRIAPTLAPSIKVSDEELQKELAK